MASNRQLLREIAFYRPLSRCRTLHSTASHRLQPPLVNHIYQNHRNPCASLVLHEGAKFYNYVPALMAGILGIRMLDVANADSEEANHKAPLPPELSSVANADSDKANPKAPLPPELSSTPSKNTLQDIARRERLRVEDMLRKKGGDYSSYPRFTVAVKGQKVSIKFQIPPACEIPLLIANLVSRLGCKDDDGGSGTSMELRAWDSGVAWQLTLTRQLKPNEADVKLVTESNSNTEDLCIVLFRPLVGSDKAEIEFMKSGSLTEDELDAVVAAIQLGGQRNTAEGTQRGSQANKASSIKTTVNNLESMGVRIYGLDEANVDTPRSEILWENIAGYTEQKREIEDTILLALQSPQVYDDIARKTRCKFETNRPRAVLFEGPPGTGKTSSARVIAKQAGIPLLYVPLEIIMSKYYGESERLLGKVFSLANDLPNGAIIFLDEIDSFATSRDGETHEATRRVLSVLLRQIDGFEQEKKVVVVAATNRKSDLDPALISRFDSMITFGLPDHQTRQEIAAQYAKHLTKSELREFANLTEDMSGRDIKDVCQQAERHWASKIIRGKATKSEDEVLVPPLQEYVDSAVDRKRAILSAGGGNENPNPFRKKPQFDFV